MKCLTTSIGTLIFLFFTHTGLAQDPTPNSQWLSEYESAGGDRIRARIVLEKGPQDQYGFGRYETQYGNGTFEQVRKELAPRTNTPPFPQGSPLPGPDSPNSGANGREVVYIKGLWTFQGSRGWFKWELYETPDRTCKFLGKWGYLENNQAGPVKGTWTATLDAPNQPVPFTGSITANQIIVIP